MVKLIAIDLDGTLFDDKKNISELNKKAIKEAREKGIKIVIASGRPFNGVKPVLEELNLLDGNEEYALCYNGAKIINLKTNEVIFEKLINYDVVNDLYNYSKEINVDIHAFKENEDLITPKNNPYTEVESTINKIETHVIDFNCLTKNDKFIKAMLVGENDKLNFIENNIPRHFYEENSMVRSSKIFLEFLNKETDKGLALTELCKVLNIDLSEVLALGDAGNDLNMLLKAGYGVAMGNSFPHIKKACKYVTDDNLNDGVAKAIYKYALNKEL